MTTVKDIDILLVDDNPSDIELTIYSLRENNLACAIYVAEDGKEALDFVFCRDRHQGPSRTARPKLILLDLKLPALNGLTVLKAIRSDERTKTIPVVILTSSRDKNDVIEGYKSGASAFIQKPDDFDHFRRTIKEIGTFWLVVNQAPPKEVSEMHASA
jgi:CheY-like chemotaxis protein